jgi:putative endonuclease
MMADKQSIGRHGENLAAQLLIDSGCTILATNWRYRRAEIDLIAREGDVIVFVEVKTKTYTTLGDPAEAVTAHKENLMIDAAAQYCISIHHDWEIRFDIITVVMDERTGKTEVTHFKDAFFHFE